MVIYMLMAEKWANLKFDSQENMTDNFKVKVPEKFNFAYDVMDALAQKKPNSKALVWCNDEGEERIFTFSDLKYYSDKCANYLLGKGIKKGDKVMLVLKRHYEFWWLILALHKIGAIGVPATHLLTKKDIIYRNNAADIKMIIATSTSKTLLESIDAAHHESPSLVHKVYTGMLDGGREGWSSFNSEIEGVSHEFGKLSNENLPQNHDIMLLYFTSGTSAMPKMVAHDFLYPLGHIQTAYFWQNVQEDCLHLTVADTGWAKTAWGKLYGQWLCECVVFVYDYSDKFKPVDLLTMIEKYKITTFCAPPTIYRFFIKANLKDYDLSSLKHCCIAGEPLNPEIYYQFLEATGLKLYEGFGQTELTLTIGTTNFMEPKPGSMGKPMPGYEIVLLDENGQECDMGNEGQIAIKTDKQVPVGLFLGYYRDEEKTALVWKDNVYYTGDVAWMDEDGYYWFVGRADDVIKSSGYRISPFEVESSLMEHPAVLETAITGVPDEIRGQIVKASVILAKGYEPSDELRLQLQNHVKKSTAPYKYPRVLEFVTELPKTISGKIRRVEIRDNDTKQA